MMAKYLGIYEEIRYVQGTVGYDLKKVGREGTIGKERKIDMSQ